MARLFLAAFLTVLAAGCGKIDKYSYDAFLMNTDFQVVIYTPGGESAAGKYAALAFELIGALETNYSATLEGSRVSILNRDGRLQLSGTDHEVFSHVLKAAAESGGAFDPTVKPLLDIWGFYHQNYRLATVAQIRGMLPRVGYRKARLTRSEITLEPGVQIDLGGILKGYAVDRAVELLQAQGVKAGLVNAGGNLRTFGMKPGGAPWVIGVRNPRGEGLYATLSLREPLAVSTSGDYERYFITNGTRYHHILNPADGYPARGEVVSVSVVDPSAEKADSLTTTLFVMGLEKGLSHAARYGIRALFLCETNGVVWQRVSEAGFPLQKE